MQSWSIYKSDEYKNWVYLSRKWKNSFDGAKGSDYQILFAL